MSKIRRWSRRQKLLYIALMLLLCVCISSGTTLAVLTVKTNSEQNSFQFGQTELDVIEDFDGWRYKRVSLQARDGDVYVPGVARAMLVPYFLNADGDYVNGNLDQMTKPVNNVMRLGIVKLIFAENWEDNWFFKDGYFYYNRVLQPGETTAQLLERVWVTDQSSENGEKYRDAELKLEVIASIIQAEGGAPEAKWNVYVYNDGLTVAETPQVI